MAFTYTAVVLDDASQNKLKEAFGSLIPDGWKTICHHMTTNLGTASDAVKPYLGKTVEVRVVSEAADLKVMAVGVECEVPSKNVHKHVTVAVNTKGGGQAKMSNDLKEWVPLEVPIVLSGVVEEVTT
jgi:hypothetical protein